MLDTVFKSKETFAPVCNRQGRKSSLDLKIAVKYKRQAVKFYNPFRCSHSHPLLLLAPRGVPFNIIKG